MADRSQDGKKPRIRKTAPTVRERAEAARVEAEKPKSPRKFRSAASRLKRPLKKLRLPDSKFVNQLKPVGGVLKRVAGWLTPRYFVNSWREVRQVTWPNRRETWRLTGAVFVFALVFGALVAGVDKGLDEIFKKVILK